MYKTEIVTFRVFIVLQRFLSIKAAWLSPAHAPLHCVSSFCAPSATRNTKGTVSAAHFHMTNRSVLTGTKTLCQADNGLAN
jgi:hypothetical protein